MVSVLTILALGFPSAAKAEDPVAAFVKFLIGKLVVDPLWDAATGKPDMKLLDERLRELESNVALRSELRDEVRGLRESINDRVTLEEFRKMAESTNLKMGAIQQRIDDLEERSEKQEVEIEDRDDGTKNAEDFEYFLKRGIRFGGETKYYRAIANLNIAIRLDPKRPAAYRQRAWNYNQLGAYGVAILDATESIDLDPIDAKVYEIRGIAYAGAKEYDKAILDFNMGIYLNPLITRRLDRHYSDVLYNRGLLFRRRLTKTVVYGGLSGPKKWVEKVAAQDLDQAITDLTAAIGYDPKDAKIYHQRGSAYRERGSRYLENNDHDRFYKLQNQALADYNECIRLGFKNEDVYLGRAWLYYGPLRSPANLDLAITDLTECLRLNPKNHYALVERGLLYSDKKDYDRAIADLTDAIRDEATAGSYHLRAGIYEAMGDAARAKADREAAKRLGN